MRKFGFTLAETLITLSIIGVVAALTIPNIIKNYQKHKTINRLKATYSTLNKALEMAKNDYGLDMNQWETSVSNDEKERADFFAEHYLIPYLKVVKDCKNENKQGVCNFWVDARGLLLANGTRIFEYSSKGDGTLAGTRVDIVIDTEPFKKRINGKNSFLVELGGGWNNTGLNRNKFWPYSYSTMISRDTIKGHIENGNPGCCFALIFYDNWQILNDNPCW